MTGCPIPAADSEPQEPLPYDVSIHLHEGDGDAVVCCRRCGRTCPFDERMPYVNQVASFASDHDCGERPGDGACGHPAGGDPAATSPA